MDDNRPPPWPNRLTDAKTWLAQRRNALSPPKPKWHKLKPGDRVWLVLATAALSAIGYANYVAPGEYPFDATLEVSELGWTYAGPSERTLINAIDTPRLAIVGPLDSAIVLHGRVQSPNPTQQARLDPLGPEAKLTLRLNTPDSRLEFAAPTGAIALQSFIISPQTRLDRLAYIPATANTPARVELTATNCPPPRCQLRLRLLTGPVRINGTPAVTAAIGARSDLAAPNLEFTPSRNIELAIAIGAIKHLELELPQQNPTPDRLFGGNFDATDLVLRQQIDRQSRNARDTYAQSTILSGEARLENKTLKLQTGQYLGFGDNSPGIERLERLQIFNPNPTAKPPSLQIFASGRTTTLSAGLNPKLPVQTIDEKWLKQFLDSEELIGIAIGFLSGVIGTLSSRLFEDD